jgi:ABC-2 type transport system ATP-binding protein
VEDTCDRIAIIKDGKIVTVLNPLVIRRNENKRYKIEFIERTDYESFLNEPFEILEQRTYQKQVVVGVQDVRINELITALHLRPIKFIREIKVTLEDYFMQYYKKENAQDESITA